MKFARFSGVELGSVAINIYNDINYNDYNETV